MLKVFFVTGTRGKLARAREGERERQSSSNSSRMQQEQWKHQQDEEQREEEEQQFGRFGNEPQCHDFSSNLGVVHSDNLGQKFFVLLFVPAATAVVAAVAASAVATRVSVVESASWQQGSIGRRRRRRSRSRSQS